ncbi:MAG: hypothetical protein NUV68_02535 [Caldiserica bacterium]|nr:hypothetical protein [Caldisericota bacterium]MDH7562577.1 hypothetical protein [Caldisericota bacterium]
MPEKRLNIATALVFLMLIGLFFSTGAWALPDINPVPDRVENSGKELEALPREETETPSFMEAFSSTPTFVSPQEKLGGVLQKLEEDPFWDPEIASTYHPEGCLDFVYLVLKKAGLEAGEIIKDSTKVLKPRDGDLIKIAYSTFYGLPHWGIYYQGMVYHNWSSLKVEPLDYFLERYPLPSSPVTIYHATFKNPASATSLFR